MQVKAGWDGPPHPGTPAGRPAATGGRACATGCSGNGRACGSRSWRWAPAPSARGGATAPSRRRRGGSSTASLRPAATSSTAPTPTSSGRPRRCSASSSPPTATTSSSPPSTRWVPIPRAASRVPATAARTWSARSRRACGGSRPTASTSTGPTWPTARPRPRRSRGFEDLVRAGKVLHVGLSEFPAWRIARAATLAELRGWAPIAGIQVEYSLVERTSDRELLPMAEALGLAVTAWSPLGGGLLSGKYRRGETGRLTAWGTLIHTERGPREAAILDAVEAVADDTGATQAQVAIAWVRAKGLFPILGPRTPAQLEDNLGALGVDLTDEQMRRLD